MRRVKSQPNIASCNAISPNVQAILDSVIVSKVPISQSMSCIVSHKFPDDLLNPNQDFVSCLMMPSDANKKEEVLTIEATERRCRTRKQRASTG